MNCLNMFLFVQAPSLIKICCSFIVKDSSQTRAAIENVPHTLRINLMQAALLGNHDRSIHVLMSQWPLNDLVLSQMVPNVFTSLLPLYQISYQSDLIRQGEFTCCNLCIRLINDSKVFDLCVLG